MNILRRYIYIYTHKRGARVANYSSNRRSTHLRRDWFSSATPRRKKGGEGKRIRNSGKPLTEVEDARARTKGGKREGERENERYRRLSERERRTEESATLKLLRPLP